MWLLNTQTAELKYFNRPEDVPGRGYAILSHVWGDMTQEDTFQKVRDMGQLRKRRYDSSADSQSTPHDPFTDAAYYRPLQYDPTQALPPQLFSVSEDHTDNTIEAHTDPPSNISVKIRNFLFQARKDGFEWAWADTCCIDKSSSAELTEAINSMFLYYSLSTVCYVYLSDVHSGRGNNGFDNSRWHKRGWTLQELLAPKTVRFMLSDWTYLGTKFELAEKLEQITLIPRDVLRFKVDVTDTSVAQRMFWASSRITTRVEDEAYCLFGLFGINMPTLYGEGRNAFFRLQEEIMRTSVDTTLFSSGSPWPVTTKYQLRQCLREEILLCPDTLPLLAPHPASFIGKRIFCEQHHLELVYILIITSLIRNILTWYPAQWRRV